MVVTLVPAAVKRLLLGELSWAERPSEVARALSRRHAGPRCWLLAAGCLKVVEELRKEQCQAVQRD